MSTLLRLVVVTTEFPFPPNHGGRADVWRRLLLLKRLGCEIMLVCWYDDQPEIWPTTEHLSKVRAEVSELKVLPNRRGIRANGLRLFQMLKGMPSHAAARAVYGEHFDELVTAVKEFNPNAVLLDNLYGGILALELKKVLGLPFFYRSHNIEHRYFAGQAAAAKSWRNRLAWSLACLHLKRFETRVMRSARVCFDISADDLVWWKNKGIKSAQWLPPLSDAAINPPTITDMPPARELAFLGNLNAPNNVQGIHWLVEDVMPLVWAKRPQTVLHIAGSRPVESIKKLLSGSERLRLYENVPDVMAFLMGSSVLVNPVLSGSGVNVKTLDMLMTSRPIISTPQGVAGLVPELKSLCLVAQGPEVFARLLLEQLDNPAINLEQREASRHLFGVEAVDLMIKRISTESQRTSFGT